jgi:hypothetical protein
MPFHGFLVTFLRKERLRVLLFMDGQTRNTPRLDDLLEFYVLASKALQYHSLFFLGQKPLHDSPKCCLMNSYTSTPYFIPVLPRSMLK